jgi:hypothetical protein
MRTSLNNIKHIDDFISGKLSPTESLIFQARVLLDSDLRQQVEWHRRTVAIINLYGRKELRNEVEKIHRDIFAVNSDHSLKHRVRNLFFNS